MIWQKKKKKEDCVFWEFVGHPKSRNAQLFDRAQCFPKQQRVIKINHQALTKTEQITKNVNYATKYKGQENQHNRTYMIILCTVGFIPKKPFCLILMTIL